MLPDITRNFLQSIVASDRKITDLDLDCGEHRANKNGSRASHWESGGSHRDKAGQCYIIQEVCGQDKTTRSQFSETNVILGP